MNVLTATTGNEAIALVESTPGLAIVLMDIMMPEMDGYQTMQVIRANPAFRRLPIIALTAKAMKGDRENCLEAAASDYLAKRVNTEQLLPAFAHVVAPVGGAPMKRGRHTHMNLSPSIPRWRSDWDGVITAVRKRKHKNRQLPIISSRTGECWATSPPPPDQVRGRL